MADIFDKCVKYLSGERVVKKKDRLAAESVLYRRSPRDNAGPWMEIDGRRVLQFSTNDYLGLAKHPKVRRAAAEVAAKVGVSAPMGSRALTGTIDLHLELERQLADFKRTEKALLFSGGAQAMMGAVAALAGRGDLVVLDRHAHASLVCGAAISGARMVYFRHNDVEHLDSLLGKAASNQPRMVVVDGVYSMGGDLAPLAEICDVCERHGARLIVDDAHGNGVCGANGRGTAELLGVEDRIDLHLGTCSKALATVGGFAAGDRTVIHYLQYTAPTVLFTKALPACIAAATLESLKLLREGHKLRKRLWENTRLLQDGLRRLGYEVGRTRTPITPIQGNGTDAVHLSADLYDKYGIWASAVLYPAVAIGTSLVRVIATASHTPEDVQLLLNAADELKGKRPRAREARVAMGK